MGNPYHKWCGPESKARMSGRGGRGGGRGGFGGRGSAGNPITIDDDGQPVIGNADGPPSLYPPMPRMPPPPELTEREEELLRIHRRLNNFWRNSCYYMDDEPEAQEIPEVKIMTYRDRLAAQEKAKTEKKAELYDVLESYKDHFPEELWAGRGKKRKRGAGDGASKGARAIGGAADSDDRLERLARLEQEKGVGEEDVDDDVEKAAGDEDEDDEGTGKRGRPRVSENADRKPMHSENKDGKKGGDKVGDDDDGDEDDFWDDDDDDYQRGADYDDDEGYDDDLGGGDDEEAFF